MEKTIEIMQESILKSYLSRFPNGWIRFKPSPLPRPEINAFVVSFGVQRPETVRGKIPENDFAYHMIMVRIPNVGEATIDIIAGGIVYIKSSDPSLALGRAKTGWRKRTGHVAALCIHFDKYMDKLAACVKEQIAAGNLVDKLAVAGF